MTEFLPHGRIRLALHRLQPARAPGAHPLLLLHALGESHAAHPAFSYAQWPGAVHALDFTGLGACIALLIAGGRPDRVLGAILLDGPGMAGSCAASTPYIPLVDTTQPAPPDPFAIAELATDARPPEYAAHFARLASQRSHLPRPITVCTREQPPWLQAVVDVLGGAPVDPANAWRMYASALPQPVPA